MKEKKINLSGKKKKFADAFMILGNGLKAAEAAGMTQDIAKVSSILLEKEVAQYIDENIEAVHYVLGRSKIGHVAVLDNLFDEAAEKKDFRGAVALSGQISKLKKWEETVQNNTTIEIDLGISDGLYQHEEDVEESEGERDDRVLAHLQAGGAL